MKPKIFLLFIFTTLSLTLAGQFTDTPLPGNSAPPPFQSTIGLQYPCTHFSTDIAPPTLNPTEEVTELPPILPGNNNNEEPTHDDRLVYWVHGLGGSPTGWLPAAHASEEINNGVEGYPARRLDSKLPDYRIFQLLDIAAASEIVKEQIEGFTNDHEGEPDTSPDFDRKTGVLIGHSQGGLVGRHVDMDYLEEPANRAFGGLVTFGSPGGGALLGTEESETLVDSIATDLCVALTESRVREFVESSFVNGLIGQRILDGKSIDEFLGDRCNFLVINGIKKLLLGEQDQDIRKDYVPGAPTLDRLRNHDRNDKGVKNKVAFYGVENEPLVWNIIHSLANKPETNGTDKIFQADDGDIEDCESEDAATGCFAIQQRNIAFEKFEEWDLVYRTKKSRESSFPLVLITCGVPFFGNGCSGEAEQIRDSWGRALNFWDSVNDRYKIAIGALEIETKDEEACWCANVETPFQYEMIPGGCNGNIPDFVNCRTVPTYTTERTEHPSDGVVLAKSAMDYPGAVKREMKGSNHQQMRNDANTKDRLFELWEGGFNTFFFTEKKQ